MSLTGHALMRGFWAALLLSLVIGGSLGAGPHSTPVLVADAAPMSGATDQTAIGREQPFIAENEAAMAKMMTDMAAKPTGDVDRDFVAMMVPHHQGAIDMAMAELRYGHNEQLRRIAQEIIVTQQQEIPEMRLAIGEPLPPSTPAPATTAAAAASASTQPDCAAKPPLPIPTR